MKIIEIVLSCQILRLKCTKFDFGCGSAPDLASSPGLLAGFQVSCFLVLMTSKGREWKRIKGRRGGKEGNRREWKGKERRKGRAPIISHTLSFGFLKIRLWTDVDGHALSDPVNGIVLLEQTTLCILVLCCLALSLHCTVRIKTWLNTESNGSVN